MSRAVRIAFIALCLAPAVALAGGLSKRFTLGKYVPADCWMYIHHVNNPESAWLEDEWQEVWVALGESKIHQDILALALSFVDSESRGNAEQLIDQVGKLLADVRWSDLMKEEFVFAERIMPPEPQYFVLVRGAEGSGAANAKALAAILEFAASKIGSVKVEYTNKNSAERWRLSGAGDYGIDLVRKDDFIGVLLGSPTVADEVLAVDSTGTNKNSILATKRFQEALELVPPAKDAVLYFDYRAVFEGTRKFFKKHGAVDGAGNEVPGVPWGRAFSAAVSACDFFDFGIGTQETRARQTHSYFVSRIQEDKRNLPLAKCVLERKPFEKFDQFVPANAKGFSLSGSIDLGLLYQTVIAFVRNEIPNGAEHLREWEHVLATLGFDPQRDVFSWLGGETIAIELPPSVVSPFGGAEKAFMIRVKDPKLAREKAEAFLSWAKERFEGQLKQPLLVRPAGDELEGFKVVMCPIVPFIQPVVGVHDQWLTIASSSSAVSRCLKVECGKAPSIRTCNRFQSEGLTPKGPVRAAFYADVSNSAQETAQALGMAGMFGAMLGKHGISAGGQCCDKGQEKAVEIVQKLMLIASKLGPVLQKIDFYNSEAGVTTCDGVNFRSERIITYKPATVAAAPGKIGSSDRP